MDRPPIRTSQGSHRFQESTHLIPTPGEKEKRPPRYEPNGLNVWLGGTLAALLIVSAIVLEIMLHLSEKNDGFHVPQKNVFAFASAQFLTSFVPAMFVAPMNWSWQAIDFTFRSYHPYVALSKGGAAADEALLLDYVSLDKPLIWYNSMRRKHYIIFTSSMLALLSLLLQPLASSILHVQQAFETSNSQVVGIRSVGLLPDVLTLNAFQASAGFAEAAVYNGLDDPPFVFKGWAAAEFVFPTNPVLNGSMSVNTTGIQTTVNCNNPSTFNLSTSSTDNYVIQATSTDQCSVSAAFNPVSSNQQYGVVSVPNCSSGPSNNITFQPVMFWFFNGNSGQSPQATSVFCRPFIRIFDILAHANLNNGSLANVTALNAYPTPNNVTGNPLAGQAFNGVVFDPNPDAFVTARATTIGSAVSGAIYRFAVQSPNGLEGTFNDDTGFLNITQNVYTQHLALAAKSIYFVPANQTLPALSTYLVPRLFVAPTTSHVLAAVFFIIGVNCITLQLVHRHKRRRLWLTSPPGSIANIVSLTARSGFGELLLPYHNPDVIKQQLSGLRFRLDRRTGAILAEEHSDDGSSQTDDAGMSLLDRRKNRPISSAQPGYPDLPWEPYSPN